MISVVPQKKVEMKRHQLGAHTVRESFVVNIEHGLHARPCAALIKALRRFKCSVEVEANGERAYGHSIISLMALAASYGTRITFTIIGKDAFQAVEAVRHLFETRFEEAYSPPTVHGVQARVAPLETVKPAAAG
jgi:phosphocarrier protein HPr